MYVFVVCYGLCSWIICSQAFLLQNILVYSPEEAAGTRTFVLEEKLSQAYSEYTKTAFC